MFNVICAFPFVQLLIYGIAYTSRRYLAAVYYVDKIMMIYVLVYTVCRLLSCVADVKPIV